MRTHLLLSLLVLSLAACVDPLFDAKSPEVRSTYLGNVPPEYREGGAPPGAKSAAKAAAPGALADAPAAASPPPSDQDPAKAPAQPAKGLASTPNFNAVAMTVFLSLAILVTGGVMAAWILSRKRSRAKRSSSVELRPPPAPPPSPPPSS